jgi:Flp pilus assembly protein TadG
VFFALLLPAFLAVIGLALDGGHLYAERADLQAVADSAARAGAAAIDTSAAGGLRDDPASPPQLDSAEAQARAAAYAEYQGVQPLDVVADAGQVTVRVGHSIPTVFLRIVRVNTLWIEARAVAHPRVGVSQADD